MCNGQMPDSASSSTRRVFISHGKEDSWIANHLARDVQGCGASTFLDETDISTGDDFKRIILKEIAACNELIALFTPWSSARSWVWAEVGVAWGQGKRIIALLYGVTVSDLERLGVAELSLRIFMCCH
jgi:TIR domain